MVLVEKSSEATSYIQKNANAFAGKILDTQVQVFHGSWDDWLPMKCDLILSNPPYLTEEEFLDLENSVKSYEPKTALVPDDIKSELRAHGPYKKILKLAADNLNSGGWIWFELGQTQPDWILEYAKTFEVFNDLRILKDMSKKNRFFCARKS